MKNSNIIISLLSLFLLINCGGGSDSSAITSHEIKLKNRTGGTLTIEYEVCHQALFTWETNEWENKELYIEDLNDTVITLYSEDSVQWYSFYATYNDVQEYFSFGSLTNALTITEDDFL